MGLSNEERYRGTAFAIKKLTHFGKNLKKAKDRDMQTLVDLLDRLWPAFFNHQSNGCHWFVGSSATNPIKTCFPKTSWEIGVTYQLDKIAERLEGSCCIDLDSSDRPYNALEESLSISSIIHKCTSYYTTGYDTVYEIYMWVEQAFYYLRRYNDEFVEQYSELNGLLSKIAGECLSFFTDRDCYPKAYLAHQICTMVYGPHYPYQDLYKDNYLTPIVEYLVKGAVHHDFLVFFGDFNLKLEDVVKIHAALLDKAEKMEVESNEITQGNFKQEVIRFIVKASKHLYEYNHTQVAFLKMVRANFSAKFVKEVNKLLSDQQKIYDENKLKKPKQFDPDNDPWACYGFSGQTVQRYLENQAQKAEESEEVSPPTKTSVKLKTKKKVVKKKVKG